MYEGRWWIVLKRLFLSLAFVALCVAHTLPSRASSDVKLPTDVEGRYEMGVMRHVGGGISTDAQAAHWSSMGACISADAFQIRDTRIANPWFSFQSVKVPAPDGEVLSSDFSIFYGVMPERKVIRRLLVFENKSEHDPYERLEVLGSGRLIDVFDGRIYLLRKVADKCTDRVHETR